MQRSTKAPEGPRLRKLCAGDLAQESFRSAFVNLLQQLSSVGNEQSDERWLSYTDAIQQSSIHTAIIEVGSQLVGFGSAVIEPKFIRSTGFVAHIEDVVVDAAFRRRGLGSSIVRHLLTQAQTAGCYKAIVDCKDSNVPFYAALGFSRKGACMSQYYEMPVIPDPRPFPCRPARERTEDGFLFRMIEMGDYERGYLDLLAQLTVLGSVSAERWKERFEVIGASEHHFLVVVEEILSQKLVAAGTLFIEQKLIRNAGLAAHIEDVVVDKDARGYGLGKRVIHFLAQLAQQNGCYKCILDCDEANVGFYTKCGFSLGHSPVFMAIYF